MILAVLGDHQLLYIDIGSSFFYGESEDQGGPKSVVAVGTCFFEYSDFVFTCDRHLGEEGGVCQELAA